MIIIVLIILQYIFFTAIIGILGYLAFILISFRNVVPYVPSPRRIIRQMLEIAEVKDNERIVDLGSGTGRIIIPAAKKYRNNLIIGIDKSFFLRLITKFRLLFHPFINKRIQVLNQDFFNADISSYDVIFCFLTPEALRQLTPKFKLLKQESRIISYMFPLEDSQGFREVIQHISAKDSIYYYLKI
ncbi:methyltransferase domain-containing protein [Candidatus Falkowbacteria bacterium]|nr:methyltransferase domain-containing protein [Candidatus Falkowbacteria bacterium]